MSLVHGISPVSKAGKWPYKIKKKGLAMYFTWPLPVTLMRVHYSLWDLLLYVELIQEGVDGGVQSHLMLIIFGQSHFLKHFTGILTLMQYSFCKCSPDQSDWGVWNFRIIDRQIFKFILIHGDLCKYMNIGKLLIIYATNMQKSVFSPFQLVLNRPYDSSLKLAETDQKHILAYLPI